MNLSAVAAEVAAKLAVIPKLRVSAYHPSRVIVPHAFPDLPETITYSLTYDRGMDEWTMPVIVMVGAVSDRASHQQISAYMDGSGPRSIKQALDSSNTNVYASCDAVTVESCTPMMLVSNAVTYLAAEFATHVAGKGSAA